MALYEILQDRAAINALKLVYLNERLEQKYVMNVRSIAAQLAFPLGQQSLQILSDHGLIAMDTAEGNVLVTITEKGKRFVEHFDKVVALFKPSPKQSSVRLEYSLTPLEWQVLLILQKMQRETGEGIIPLKVIRDELYPHNKTSISSYVKKLLELNLIEKQQRGREIWITFSAAGQRLMEQKLMGIV